MSSPGPLRPSGAPAPSRRRRWLRRLWPALVVAALGSGVGVAVAAAIHMPRVESLADFTPSRITQLYDHEGQVYSSFARQRRIVLSPQQFPERIKQAVIAVEDKNFYRHGGLDLTGIVRAMVTNLRRGHNREGASTLTMQLARQLFLTSEKTWRRKIEETFLAVELEKNYSKEQILALYLNYPYLGHGQYGVAAAANYYFGKTVGELSLPEAATLAGIFQRPSRYSPYNNAKAVLERRNHVLERMLEDGYIDRLQYHDAVGEPLKVVPHGPREESGSYFAEEIRRHLETTLGTTSLLEGGLKVETTLDLAIQRSVDQGLREGLLRLDHRRGYRGPQSKVSGKAEEAELKSWSAPRAVADNWFEGVVLESTPSSARIKHLDEVLTLTPEGIAWTGKTQPNRLLNRGDVAWFRIAPLKEGGPPILRLEQEPELQGAAMVIESATGAVRAMAGGWDFGRNQFNRATQARRQAGSAFKMFVYGTALENGYTPADTIFDAPVWLKGADGRLSYSPHNYYNTYYGIVTLQRALEQSFNVSAVKLSDAVGLDKVIQFARRAGISTDLPPYPSIALGAADLVPLELTAAYSSIANGGVWMEPYLLEKVATPEGNVLERHSPRTRLVTSPQVAAVLRRMLEGVVDRGTARALSELELDIAGKTGTTNDYSNAWFVGFTPRYTMGVWVGYDRPHSMGHGMAGDKVAVPIWKDIALDGLKTGWITKNERFSFPDGVVTAWVSRASGGKAAAGTPGAIEVAFLAGTEPGGTGAADSVLSLPWFQQRAFYSPKAGERMPEEGDPTSPEDAESAPAPPDDSASEAPPPPPNR